MADLDFLLDDFIADFAADLRAAGDLAANFDEDFVEDLTTDLEDDDDSNVFATSSVEGVNGTSLFRRQRFLRNATGSAKNVSSATPYAIDSSMPAVSAMS